jgi:hypothetical protein
VYGRARRLLPPQVGVLGGVRPSAPAATPSSGSILSGTSLKSFQRSHLGTFPKFLQRSQQLVWWKLPSSTYMLREVHPVNILTVWPELQLPDDYCRLAYGASEHAEPAC